MFHFKITNIKLSLKTSFICLSSVQTLLLKKDLLGSKKISVKEYANFLVIKHIFTYVLFKSSNKEINHCNITNVSKFSDIDYACDHFLKTLLQELNVTEIFRRVDNISATLNLFLKINIHDIIPYFKSKCNIGYNSEKFPGVFLKFKEGTVIIFHTGKCVFIGCKTKRSLECLETFIQMYVTTKIK